MKEKEPKKSSNCWKKDRLISYLGSELICHGNFSVHCHSDTILWSWGEAKGQKCDACDNLSFSFAWRGEVQCRGDFFLENEWKFYENEQLWRPRDGASWCENLRHLAMVNSNSQTQNNLQQRWKMKAHCRLGFTLSSLCILLKLVNTAGGISVEDGQKATIICVCQLSFCRRARAWCDRSLRESTQMLDDPINDESWKKI